MYILIQRRVLSKKKEGIFSEVIFFKQISTFEQKKQPNTINVSLKINQTNKHITFSLQQKLNN